MLQWYFYWFFIGVIALGTDVACSEDKSLNIEQLLCKMDRAYQNGNSRVSDAVYDSLSAMKEQHNSIIPNKSVSNSRALNKRVPDSMASTPCWQISEKLFSQSHHAFMGSLHKANSVDEVQRFLQRIKQAGGNCILQPKVDGIAVELIYHKGMLVAASTRGNGWCGRNILDKVKASRNIPLMLPVWINTIPETVVLHGELYLRRDQAQDALKDYRRARHKVAGLMMQKHPDNHWLAWLDFYPWLWVDSPHADIIHDIKQFSSWGFGFVAEHSHPIEDTGKVTNLRWFYKEKNYRTPFLMDGVVIKTVSKPPGPISNHPLLPDEVLAWKFPPDMAAVKIDHIVWKTGKTGKQTAMLLFKPTTLGSVTVSKVSAGGQKSMNRHNIHAGDIISIALKGQAIPVFDRVLVRLAGVLE